MAEFDLNLAVVIGINEYQEQFGISKLTTARPDAEKLDEILREQHYEVDLLVDEQATFDGITNYLTTTLPEKIKADRRVRLLFYFAGHGTTPQDEEGEAGYLIPQDAEPNNRGKFLSMGWVHDALTKLSCHHLLIILDCCFAGAFRFTTRHFGIIPEEISQQRYDRYINHRAWQVITSAAHDQKAVDIVWDNRAEVGAKHSPFAEALFQALENQAADYTKDGITTATELYLYLNNVLLEKNQNKPQVPRFWPLKEHDKGEFIFLTGEFDQTKLPEAPALNINNNPYRGLESFDEAHNKFFFGREELVAELEQHLYLIEHSFTVVLGVSGSGKSSLVKAGLIPTLREDKETKWRILEPIRPTADPFHVLSRTMLSLVRDSEESEWQLLKQLDELLKQVRKRFPQDRELAELQSTWRRSSPIDKLWLVIQHFEQLNKWFDHEADRRSLQTLRQIGLNRSQLVLEHFETLRKPFLSETERTPLLNESERQQVEIFYQSCISQIEEWSQDWKSDRQQFSNFARGWCQSNSSWRLLLVVDQFEELITQCDKDIREAFLDLLSDVLKVCPEQLHIVATLRADFEPRFIDSEQLKPFWDKARFLMRAMRSDELRRAIEGPALEHILYFETESDRNLVDQLIDEVGQMPGALPLLSFALSEIYREYVRQDNVQDRTLKWKHYRKVGGVAGSLTRRATEEYDRLLKEPDSKDEHQGGFGNKEGKAYQATMQRVMLRMVAIEGGGVTRRRVPRSELVYENSTENKRVEQIIRRLDKARLLITGQEAQLKTGQKTVEGYIEPAHDFLVNGWEKLQQWIKEEQDNLVLRQRLTIAANTWIRREGSLWVEEADRLIKLNEVIDSDSTWLNRLETVFVKRSSKVRQDRIKRLEEDLRISEERRTRAESLSLATQAASVGSTQPQLNVLLANESLGVLKPGNLCVPRAEEALRESLSRISGLGFGHAREGISNVTISPDSLLAAVSDNGGNLRLWNLSKTQCIAVHREVPGEAIVGLVFLNDQDSIVSVARTGILLKWSLPNLDNFQILRDDLGEVIYVATDPSRKWLATGTSEGKITLLDLSRLSSLDDSHQSISHPKLTNLIFSDDERWLISTSWDGTARLWPVPPHSAKMREYNHRKATDRDDLGVMRAGVNSNGRWLVTLSNTHHPKPALLWDLEVAMDIASPIDLNPSDSVMLRSLVFDSQNHYLYISGTKIHRWDLHTANIPESRFDFSEGGVALAVTPNSQTLIAANSEIIFLWSLEQLNPSHPVKLRGMEAGNSSSSFHVLISPDGKWLLSFQQKNYGTLRCWDLHSIQEKAIGPRISGFSLSQSDVAATFADNKWLVMGDHQQLNIYFLPFQDSGDSNRVKVRSYPLILGRRTDSRFSPNGRWLTTGGLDGVVRLWDLNNDNNKPSAQISVGSEVSFAEPHGDPGWVLIGSEDNYIRLWSPLKQNLDSEFLKIPVPPPHNTPSKIVLTPNQQWLAAACGSKVYLWHLDQKMKAIESPLPVLKAGVGNFTSGNINQLVASSNSHWMAAVSDDSNTYLWSLPTNYLKFDSSKIEVLRGHFQNVLSAVFSRNSQFLYTGSYDGAVYRWDLSQDNPNLRGTIVYRGSARVDALAIELHDNWLLAVSSQGIADQIPLNLNKIRELACEVVGRPFTPEEWQEYFSGSPPSDT